MNRPIRIISIDGTRGAGKTSQIAALSRYFKSIGFKVSTLNAISGEPIQSGMIAVNFIEGWLPKDPKNIVILDGSVARPIVGDIMSGMSTPNILDKYKLLMHGYERLEHQYGVASFLMIMDDLDECNRRIAKHKVLVGKGNDEIVDLHLEDDVVNGMKFFNNHVASKNLQFQSITVLPHESILMISKVILNKISEKYDLDQPKKNDEEW